MSTPDTTKHDPAVVHILIAVLTGGIAVIFDSTIVSVALKQLSVDLEAPLTTIQWVTTGYLLALGISIPLVGWLQSRLGGKRLWMLALTLFLLGSVLCSFAWSAESLIAFRVIQGLGGGAMMPLMMTLPVQAAGGRDLGRLMAVAALPTALGPILGPVVGGLILGAGDWQWLFLVNVPLCLVGLVLAWRLIPSDSAFRTPVKLDVVGLLLLSPALVGILWGLSNVTGDGGFGRTDVWAPLAGGLLLLVGFVLWAVRRRGTALVDLQVLRHRATWAGTLMMFILGATLYGAMLLLPLYWQELRGADALGAGLLLITQGVGTLVTRTLAPRLMDLIGARGVVMLGCAVAALATVPFAFAGPDTSYWLLEAALLVRGFGLGVVFIPLLSVSFLGLERAEVPHASILTRVAQQVGGSLGVAVLAVLLATVAQSSGSLTTGFEVAFWVSVGLAGAGILVAAVLPGRAPRAVAPDPVEAVAEAA